MTTAFKIKLSAVVVFQICSLLCIAQQKNVYYNGDEELQITYDQLNYLAAGDSALTLTAATAYYTIGKFTANHSRFINLGIANDNYWVQFSIVNKTAISTQLIINLENPRLNEVEFYSISKNKSVAFFRLGDNFSFSKRPFHFNQFAIPVTLTAADTVQVFMLIKHKGNTLQVPVSIHTQNSLLKKAENNYLITGITSGILLLTFFFSFFLFIKSQNSLFGFYSMYVLSTFMWLISTGGYGFQYLWPEQTEWATRFGPGFSIFNLCSFIAVALAFTKQYDNTKWVRKLLTGIVLLTFLWGLQAFMPYVPIHNAGIMPFFLKISFIIYAVSLGCIMSYLLYVSIRKNKTVLYYFFACISIVVFSFILIAHNSGWINLPFTSGSFISISLVFEIILMTLGIASQFYQYKKEKEEMLIAYIEQQKSITEKILDTQEQERKRISREMHDDIGAGLTQITLMSESAKENNAVTKLDDIAETSRQLVNSISEIIWSLNPENKTLAMLCAYLREQLNKQLEYSGMTYSIVLPENEDTIILTNEQRRNFLLVTKEIVNNAIKYSCAKNITVNAALKINVLTFIVEDNGNGFDMEKKYSGNGMKNILNRMEEMGGELIKTSLPGGGCRFTYGVLLTATT